jgi:bifunctional UDP-N-acetylglucosamine pyrophosphorylase/glucosamine-1-phosphate N-acetyltransferase
VSRDVAAGELRMVRAEQLMKPGWADRFHDTMKKKKEAVGTDTAKSQTKDT